MRLFILLIFLATVDIVYSHHNPFHGYYNYTFGQRINGDVLSYNLKDYIPIFHHIHQVKLSPQRNDVVNNFTGITVELKNKFTAIFVNYDPSQLLVTFRWKYPFIRTAFEITGYSLPKLLRHSHLTALRILINDLNY